MLKNVEDLFILMNEKGFEYDVTLKGVSSNSKLTLKEPKMIELKYVGYKPHRIVTEEMLFKGIIFNNNHGQLGSTDGFINSKINLLIYNGSFKLDLPDFLDINLIE